MQIHFFVFSVLGLWASVTNTRRITLHLNYPSLTIHYRSPAAESSMVRQIGVAREIVSNCGDKEALLANKFVQLNTDMHTHATSYTHLRLRALH